MTLRNQREAIAERGRTEANLAAALVALTVKSNADAVRMVAQSPALDDASPDIARFDVIVRRILAHQRDWHAAALADGEGRLLFSTEPHHRDPKDFGIDAATLAVARTSDEPQVGRVLNGRDGDRAFPITVAVRDARGLRFVVSVLIPAAQMRPLLRVDPLAPGWTATILTPSGPLAAIAGDDGQAGASDRPPVALSAPVDGTGWTIRITAPANAFLAPVRRAALLLVVAAAICLMLLVLLARVLATELRQAHRRDAIELQRQRMEALGRLTGGVAHDFNNLLTPIMISLDLIGQRSTDPRSARQVESAMAAAERAQLLVSRLLSFSRQQQLLLEPIDVPALIDQLMDLIEKSLTPAIAMDVQVAPGLPAVTSDRSQLELAILNLVINARDAMAAGGRLVVAARPAPAEHRRGLAGEAFVEIVVSDTGTGMDAATVASATDPFFTTKPVGKGTGLGLSMVQGLAFQSGGTFLLESEIGKGTSAIIVLPCSDERPVARASEPVTGQAESLRILIVDDDDRVRAASAEVLAEAGHAVEQVANVDQAIVTLESGSAIDLVITDFTMPRRSGAELVELMRARWPQVAVLMITGHTEDRKLPADVDMLFKPYRPANLLNAVEAAARKRG